MKNSIAEFFILAVIPFLVVCSLADDSNRKKEHLETKKQITSLINKVDSMIKITMVKTK
jgi:hypothetical protein